MIWCRRTSITVAESRAPGSLPISAKRVLRSTSVTIPEFSGPTTRSPSQCPGTARSATAAGLSVSRAPASHGRTSRDGNREASVGPLRGRARSLTGQMTQFKTSVDEGLMFPPVKSLLRDPGFLNQGQHRFTPEHPVNHFRLEMRRRETIENPSAFPFHSTTGGTGRGSESNDANKTDKLLSGIPRHEGVQDKCCSPHRRHPKKFIFTH